jgi:hypothetical protein
LVRLAEGPFEDHCIELNLDNEPESWRMLAQGSSDLRFDYPSDLCVAGDTLFVCDLRNSRIVVLGTDLSWRYTIGCEGTGDGEFGKPTAVAAHGGELYVADHDNGRVQVFGPDRDGRMQFRRKFGGLAGPFKTLAGLAIVRGLLVVSEAGTGLQVMSLAGAVLQVLTDDFDGVDVAGLCAGPGEKQLWLADASGHSVHVFTVKP